MDPNRKFLLWRLSPRALRQRVAGHPHLQKIVANIGWLVADNLLRMLIALCVGVWVARYLGPASFGELNFAMALVGMFAVVAGLGIDSNVLRDLVREPERQGEILGTTFVLKVASASLSALACVSAIFLLRPQSEMALWLVGILSIGMLFLTAETISLWFQARVESKLVVYARNAAYVIGALVRCALILANAPLLAFALAALVESFLAAVGLVLVYRSKRGVLPAEWTVGWRRARRMLHEGWPLLLASISSVLYLRLDMIMLGEMGGNHAVGIYGAATRLSEAWYFLPTAILSSLQPALIREKERSQERYCEILLKTYRLMAALSISVSVVLTLTADSIVALLYGAQYEGVGLILKLHIWASVAVFLGVASSHYLVVENQQRLSFYRTAIGLACNAALNIVLIPRMGATGAALATLVSYFVATFSLALFPASRIQSKLMLQSIFPGDWFRQGSGRPG